MTIGIGVLATDRSSQPPARPDTIIFIADTLGTALDGTSSTQRLHKIFFAEHDGVYAVAADNINNAGEIFSRIVGFLRNEPSRASGAIFHCIHLAVSDYHRSRIEKEVLPKYTWIKGDLDSDETKELVRDECLRFNLGCELIVGAFDELGRAMLYETFTVGHTEQEGGSPTIVLARGNTIPGFAAIGNGRDVAEFWLNYRDHTLSYSPQRAAYHAYEAKRMAENSPHVNDKIELLVASRNGFSWIHDERPIDGDWSLARMHGLFSLYGPRRTEGLDLTLSIGDLVDPPSHQSTTHDQ